MKTEAGPAQLFPKLTEHQVYAMRVGTVAYQMMHPYNKESPASAIHYKSLVTPSMRKPSKSMSKHLGMGPLFGGKNGGTI